MARRLECGSRAAAQPSSRADVGRSGLLIGHYPPQRSVGVTCMVQMGGFRRGGFKTRPDLTMHGMQRTKGWRKGTS